MGNKNSNPSSLFEVANDGIRNKGPISKSQIEEVLKLSLRLKKKVIQSSFFNAQTFPMLVSLNVDNLKSSARASIDLVCAIDHSGSMSGEKLELVKNTFTYLLKYLGDDDRLSIVIFDHKASILLPLTNTTQKNKNKILSKIRGVKAEGSTNINLGMKKAFDILNDRKYKNPVSSIFLLSDGLDDGAQNNVHNSVVALNVQEDITINTFGFGNDHDPQLMNDIADLRDGNFYFIKELDTVDEAFVDCLGELLSAVGQNVLIKIKAEKPSVLPGVEIVKAYGDNSMWIREGDYYITKLSTLVSGVQKDFVLELSIPQSKNDLQDYQKNITVASAEASITTLDGKQIIRKAELNITLLNEGEEFQDEEDDREVMKNFFRLKGALVIDEARKWADQSKHDKARKNLKCLKEELKYSFLKTEEFIKNLIKDIDQAIVNVSPIVYEQAGKLEMMENARAQLHQKSNLKSANCYRNEIQEEMLEKVKAMKNRI